MNKILAAQTFFNAITKAEKLFGKIQFAESKKLSLLRNQINLYVPPSQTSWINWPNCWSTFPKGPSRIHNVPLI